MSLKRGDQLDLTPATSQRETWRDGLRSSSGDLEIMIHFASVRHLKGAYMEKQLLE